MQGYQEKNQMQFLCNGLKEMLNPHNVLYTLSSQIPWDALEKTLSPYYSDWGRPAKPVRLMVSLLLLKHLCNMSDERVVRVWSENPYWQYLSGAEEFCWRAPCEASDLVHFRNRLGEEGIQEIFKMTIHLHGVAAYEKEVLIDTTVQEKNITYPTDTKLCVKIIDRCVSIAREEGIKLRQTYTRTKKKLQFAQRGYGTRNGHKRAKAAARKLRIIAGRLTRDIQRKVPKDTLSKYTNMLDLFTRFLGQKKNDKNKIYSFHEPDVYCVSKGKDHKKYEFGSKVSIVETAVSGIIVGALNHAKNIYDGHTLPEVLAHVEETRGIRPEIAIVDRGYRGTSHVGTTTIINPYDLQKKRNTKYEKQKIRKKLRRRAGIEPAIGHLKSDYRLSRNYLKGVRGDAVNVLLAASAWNINKLIIEIEAKIFFIVYYFVKIINQLYYRKRIFSFFY